MTIEKLQIRPLNFDDFLTFLDLLKKIELIDPIQKVVTSSQYRQTIVDKVADGEEAEESEDLSEDKEKVMEVGFLIITDLAKLVIEKIPENKGTIYNFLAQVTETDANTIKQLPPSEAIGLLMDFFMSSEFKELWKLRKRVGF